MMTALLLPVALTSAGVAMDLTRMVQIKSELQNAADAAALAAASAMSGKGMTEAQARDMAEKFLASQLVSLLSTGSMSAEDIENLAKAIKDNAGFAAKEKVEGSAKTFDITVTARYDLPLNPLSSLLGYETVPLHASSTAQSATESKNALSMFLVLDRSGSMAEDTDTVNTAQPTKQVAYSCYSWDGRQYVVKTCYRTETNYVLKIDALKIAVADLTAQLDKADPDKKYVRTAAVSYNSSTQAETTFSWNTATVKDYVNKLTATGRTASTGATKVAYEKLVAASENTAHKNKNGQVPSKYIVLMTDGDNNNTSDDTATIGWCNKAKENNIEIFSVAFMAPSRGQTLLKNCASSAGNYYDARNAVDLVKAFQNIGQKASQAMTRLTN